MTESLSQKTPASRNIKIPARITIETPTGVSEAQLGLCGDPDYMLPVLAGILDRNLPLTIEELEAGYRRYVIDDVVDNHFRRTTPAPEGKAKVARFDYHLSLDKVLTFQANDIRDPENIGNAVNPLSVSGMPRGYRESVSISLHRLAQHGYQLAS